MWKISLMSSSQWKIRVQCWVFFIRPDCKCTFFCTISFCVLNACLKGLRKGNAADEFEMASFDLGDGKYSNVIPWGIKKLTCSRYFTIIVTSKYSIDNMFY